MYKKVEAMNIIGTVIRTNNQKPQEILQLWNKHPPAQPEVFHVRA